MAIATVEEIAKNTFDEDITIIKKDLAEDILDNSCDILIGSKLFSSGTILNNASESITESGFILSVESHQYNLSELHKLDGFVVISECKTDENSYVLLRQVSRKKYCCVYINL